MVIDCSDREASLGIPTLTTMYNATVNVIALSNMAENLPPSPLSADIPKGKSVKGNTSCKDIQTMLKDGKT